MDVLGKLIEIVHAEWSTIKGAPVAIFLTCSAIVVSGWGFINWYYGIYYSQQIANRDSTITTKDSTIQNLMAQVRQYRDQLQGRSPVEAAERIKELEGKVAALQARYWSALTKDQTAALRSRISSLPNDKLVVHCAYAECNDLSKSILEALRARLEMVGWGANL